MDRKSSQNKSVATESVGKRQKLPKLSVFRLFRFATLPEIAMILCATIFSIAAGVLLPMSITVFGDLLKNVTVSDMTNLVSFMLPKVKKILCLATGLFIASYASNCLWILTGASQAHRIRSKYLHAALRQEIAWFDTAEEGSLNTRLATDTQLIQDGISENFGQAIAMIAQFIGGFAVAFTRDTKLSAVMVVLLPSVALTGGAVGMLIQRYTTRYQDAQANAASIAEQVFGNIRTVYSLSMESQFLQRYADALCISKAIGIKKGASLGFGVGLVFCMINFNFALGVWYGYLRVRQGIIAGVDVPTVLFAMMVGAMALLQIPPLITAVSGATGAAHRIYALIDRNPEIDSDSDAGVVPQKATGKIKFKQVNFYYPSRPQQHVLKNFDLEIRPGMTVALVGSSGSGKSTAIQLLQRFYDPVSGQIFIGEHDLKTLNIGWVRQQIGIVSQEPVLFNMTIKENILMGVSCPVSSETLVSACKQANCHDFILQLPDGYDTVVGPQGGSLSGGQKQRISIARAIIKNPAILLLDEATSALDTKSEYLVQRALDVAAANRTTFVVAHRLSTIRNADMIVVLDEGEIVERGTHKSLVERGGIYAEMVKKQEIIASSDNNTSIECDTDEDTKLDQDLETSEDDKAMIIPEKILPLNRQIITDSTRRSKQMVQKRLSSLDGSKKIGKIIRKIIRYMRPEWPLLVSGFLGSTSMGVFVPFCALNLSKFLTAITTPGVTLEDGPLTGANLHAFLFVMNGLGVLVACSVQIGSFEAAGERFAYRLQYSVFKSYVKQEVSYFDQPECSAGFIISTLAMDAKNVKDIATKGWGDIIQIIVTIVLAMTIAFTHNWRLSLIIIGIMPLIAGTICFHMKLQVGSKDSAKKANAESGKLADEAIKEIRTVTSLHRQSYYVEKYIKYGEVARTLCRRKAFLSSLSHAMLFSLTLYIQAIVFFAAGYFIDDGWMKFSELLPSLLVITLSAVCVGGVCTFLPDYEQGKLSAISIFEILERRPTIDPELEGIEPCSVQGEIAFDNVKFAYPSRPGQTIFDGDFNLHGNAGQKLALVGHSGCGKSTIIALLQRWYDSQGGKVLLDDHNVRSYGVQNLRSHMALVGQEPVLFDMTIGENIRAGISESQNASQDQVDQACKDANIYDFIMTLPEKYDTPVGDKGSQLSGGQKQRIAIARALIRKPKVLLLDEATSALDGDSEKAVQEALDNIIETGGRTTVTIAHRLSTIQTADTIFVLKDGQVIEQGNHQELLEMNGVYSEIANQQSLYVD